MASAGLDPVGDRQENDVPRESFVNAWLAPVLGIAILICAVICFFLTIALWFGYTTGECYRVV